MLRNMVRTTMAVAKKALAWDLKDISPPTEQMLFTFASESEIAAWQPYSDAKYGGLSTCILELSEGRGVFHGSLSLDFDREKTPYIKRSGFAGIRTKKEHGKFDLQPFNMIEMRLRGDGRCYLTSLRTQNWVDNWTELDDNTWQTYVHTTKDEWKVYKLPVKDYLPTWQGRIVKMDAEMNLSRVVGMGFHVAAGTRFGEVQGTGPFKLEFDWIRGVRTEPTSLQWEIN